jgi:hypothetical protein
MYIRSSGKSYGALNSYGPYECIKIRFVPIPYDYSVIVVEMINV